ncbi:Nucleotide-binding universal stress protein, UspA family [Cupriavidus sp. YR651]|uniref:universal stress protein n=1 Tax=Cupriavidus sp. YR651 TaxID=1855315 RepID=UPI00088E22A3|nr:universal stress protein [Cupriavidus sp. YR651]SDD39052.1 Nucleotide-binding universal stress protein, UspA family [Cupriavidus sp. YR651]
MFKHVLLPVDGTELSQKAVTAAISFARTNGARLTPYMCVPEYPFVSSSDAGHEKRSVFEKRVKDEAQAELSKIEAAAAQAGVPCQGAISVSAAPYRGIIAMANELECDVIFMASHGRSGLSGLLLGSETQKVLTHSQIPVLVFR